MASSHEMRTPLVADDDQDDSKHSPLLLNTPDHSKHHQVQSHGHVQNNSVQIEEGKSTSFNAFIIFCAFIAFLVALYFIGKFAASGPGHNNEVDFQNGISPDRIREYLQFYTNASHIAGSIRDKETADWTAAMMKQMGIPVVEVEEYDVLLAYPINRTVQILSAAGAEFTAVMRWLVISLLSTRHLDYQELRLS